MRDAPPSKPTVRARANSIRDFRCKNLVVVLECPEDVRNIGTVIRNVNALGAEKVYVVDDRRSLPDDWHEMRESPKLTRTSASAVKWSFVKRFDTTEACLKHLQKKGFVSVATSPHVKGRKNVSLGSGNYTKQTKLAVWFGNENHGINADQHAATGPPAPTNPRPPETPFPASGNSPIHRERFARFVPSPQSPASRAGLRPKTYTRRDRGIGPLK